MKIGGECIQKSCCEYNVRKTKLERYTNPKRHLASSLGKWTNKKSILELINILDHL
jgi:hypothetical protein